MVNAITLFSKDLLAEFFLQCLQAEMAWWGAGEHGQEGKTLSWQSQQHALLAECVRDSIGRPGTAEPQEQWEAAQEVIGGQQPYPHGACQGQPAAVSEIKGKETPTSLSSVESKELDLVFLSSALHKNKKYLLCRCVCWLITALLWFFQGEYRQTIQADYRQRCFRESS